MSMDRLPVATGGQAWRWARRELRERWGAAAVTLAVGVAGAAASVVPVYELGVLVDKVRAGAEPAVIGPIAVIIAVAAVAGGIATGVTAYLVARLGGHALAGLRERTVGRVLRLPTGVVERAGRGELLSRVGSDVAAVNKAVTDVLPQMISAVLLAALSLATMAGIDWRLGLAGLVAVPMYALGLRWYLPRSAPVYARERAAAADRSQQLVETMQGIRTVHAYRRERERLRAVDAASALARDLSVSVFTLFTRFVGRVNRAEFVGLAAIVVVGFALVRDGAVQVGEASAAAVLFHRLFNPVAMLLFTFDDLQAAGASLARLVGVVAIPEPPRPATAGRVPADASLEIRGVRFSYDGTTDVLHGVDIRLEPGQRVALVGSTGAGKSTLAGIAAGLLSPRVGTALLGGVPVDEVDRRRLREHVAIISQETHVFAGPLIEDPRLARPAATADEVAAALATVGAAEWVAGLPDGPDTVVGEGGHELTAAQAQQLALARMVLADPAVAILDEATAEAGSLGARELEASAAAATAGRTTLVVAHRLTQAVAADRVVVLEHGRVVEEGTHAELVTAGGRYAQLWRAWQTRAPVPASHGPDDRGV